jgi:hypothetical protein
MRRLRSIPFVAAAISAAIALPASAAPGGGSGQSTFAMTCNGEVVTLSIGGGIWSAAYVEDTKDRFIPEVTHVQVFDTESGEVVFEEVDGKGSADTGHGAICVMSWEEEGSVVVFSVYGKQK